MESKQFESLIQHFKNKISLSEAEEELIISKLRSKRYLKGQYIIQEEDVYKYQTFIVKGKVKTFYMAEDGNEHVIAFGLDNWWVGDLCSFTTQTPAMFNTVCLEETLVSQISYEAMEFLYNEIPQLEKYFRLILEKAYGNTTKRIVRNHAMSAIDRYVLFTEEYPEIVNQVPQYMIASYLGITKEFLSSIKKQL